MSYRTLARTMNFQWNKYGDLVSIQTNIFVCVKCFTDFYLIVGYVSISSAHPITMFEQTLYNTVAKPLTNC